MDEITKSATKSNHEINYSWGKAYYAVWLNPSFSRAEKMILHTIMFPLQFIHEESEHNRNWIAECSCIGLSKIRNFLKSLQSSSYIEIIDRPGKNHIFKVTKKLFDEYAGNGNQFKKLPKKLFYDERLSQSEKSILIAICLKANSEWEKDLLHVQCDHRWITKISDCHENTILPSVKKLISYGIIVDKERQYKQANMYTLSLRHPDLLCGVNPDLLCGVNPDLLCGVTERHPDLLCGVTERHPDLLCGVNPDLLCGVNPDLLCGHSLRINNENNKIRINECLSPAATPPVDKSDLCHFDVIESVTAPLEESMSNSDPDPFKAFDSVSDLDQSCEVSTTTTKDGLESIEAPELVLGSSPEPKTAKKRLKRDQTGSKKTDKPKQTDGSLFLDLFNDLRVNYKNGLYNTKFEKRPKNNKICAEIVSIIKSPIERHVMLLWFFSSNNNDKLLTRDCTHSLNIFYSQIKTIQTKANMCFKTEASITNAEVDYQYANAQLIETATGYRIEFAPPQQKNID